MSEESGGGKEGGTEGGREGGREGGEGEIISNWYKSQRK